MRPILLFLLSALSAACASQQQPGSSAPAPAIPPPSAVYYAGPGVEAPELIPPQISPAKSHHCKKLDGKTLIGAIVDANGKLLAPLVMQPADGKLNEAALALLAMDHFKPGTRDGMPAAIGIQIEVGLKTCSRDTPEERGEYTLATLRDKPTQKLTISPRPSPDVEKALAKPPRSPGEAPSGAVSEIGRGVIAPIPLNTVVAHYTAGTRKAKISGYASSG